ncbi:MAG: anthranilate phosphoribosyltransferase [Candidatus Nitrosopelagicus sp.]|nr:anthranilate phosphoribosyltransferase [Candidatus Nitrosopelagicus sp.]
MKNTIEQLLGHQSLTQEESRDVMYKIMSGEFNDAQISGFLIALRAKGESSTEIAGFAQAMREKMTPIKIQSDAMDMCGTGRDAKGTFNISTASSFVVAGAGVHVAKHGNRSVSGVSGSADIFEYFGFDLSSKPWIVEESIEKIGIGFMFAPTFHPAMKNVAPARKLIGKRTAFNLLGPLCNPAKVRHQMIGVFADKYIERIVRIMQKNFSDTVLAVRSDDGMDELSTTSKNKACLLKNEEITEFIIDPSKYNMEKGNLSNIQISTKQEAIDAFAKVLNNTSNKTMKEITILNAAGGLLVGGICDRFDEGVELALETINNGNAFKKLKQFTKENNALDKLEEFE